MRLAGSVAGLSDDDAVAVDRDREAVLPVGGRCRRHEVVDEGQRLAEDRVLGEPVRVEVCRAGAAAEEVGRSGDEGVRSVAERRHDLLEIDGEPEVDRTVRRIDLLDLDPVIGEEVVAVQVDRAVGPAERVG